MTITILTIVSSFIIIKLKCISGIHVSDANELTVPDTKFSWESWNSTRRCFTL